MKKKLVIANWKMNPVKLADAKKVLTGTLKEVAGVKAVQVVVCPPTVFLPELSKAVKGAGAPRLCVQDLFHEGSGAYTGQTSPQMAKQFKATWAILGHSERRERGEDNETVGRKVRYAIAEGYTAVLCIGERERNEEGAHYTFVRDELEAVFAGLKRKDLEKLVIAYEPVWAIGKRAEEAMQTHELYEMALFIKKLLIERYGRKPAEQVSVLYGGSVKPENAEQIVREGGVDGLLVGSASLDPKQYGEIVRAVQTVAQAQV
jgi:triosephosphate isomerase (TIM)